MDQQGLCSRSPDLADYSTTLVIQQLQEPLQSYMIPNLTARAFATLRAACKSFQRLVDNAPLGCMLPALQHQPAAAFLPEPSDSLAAQGRLKQQAASISAVTAAQPSSIYSIQVTHGLAHANLTSITAILIVLIWIATGIVHSEDAPVQRHGTM